MSRASPLGTKHRCTGAGRSRGIIRIWPRQSINELHLCALAHKSVPILGARYRSRRLFMSFADWLHSSWLMQVISG